MKDDIGCLANLVMDLSNGEKELAKFLENINAQDGEVANSCCKEEQQNIGDFCNKTSIKRAELLARFNQTVCLMFISFFCLCWLFPLKQVVTNQYG